MWVWPGGCGHVGVFSLGMGILYYPLPEPSDWLRPGGRGGRREEGGGGGRREEGEEGGGGSKEGEEGGGGRRREEGEEGEEGGGGGGRRREEGEEEGGGGREKMRIQRTWERIDGESTGVGIQVPMVVVTASE